MSNKSIFKHINLTIKTFFKLAITCIVLVSCDPCYGERGVCADLFFFRVVDKTTGEDLVFRPLPVYSKDSVYLTTTLAGYYGAISSADTDKFISRLAIPVDTFYLRISINDNDTLLMSYDFRDTKCCNTKRGFGKLTSIKFNGINANKQGDVFLFPK